MIYRIKLVRSTLLYLSLLAILAFSASTDPNQTLRIFLSILMKMLGKITKKVLILNKKFPLTPASWADARGQDGIFFFFRGRSSLWYKNRTNTITENMLIFVRAQIYLSCIAMKSIETSAPILISVDIFSNEKQHQKWRRRLTIFVFAIRVNLAFKAICQHEKTKTRLTIEKDCNLSWVSNKLFLLFEIVASFYSVFTFSKLILT